MSTLDGDRGAAVPRLHEREAALAVLARAFERAASGEAAVVLVTGSAGVGKTSVLRAASRAAADAGLTVLSATCTPLEQEYAFGAVRQLLRTLVRAEGPAAAVLELVAAAPAQGQGADGFAVLDALYWALADLADRGPLALLVDDAHWCDDPSSRWLGFLARRLEGLPVALVVTTRPSGSEALRALEAHPSSTVLELAALSPAGAAGLLADRAGTDLPDDVVHKAHTSTGGNPFYLTVLARAVRELGTTAVRGALDGQDGPLADTVRRRTVARLAELGAVVLDLARATAVLGPDARTASLAVLLGVAPADAEAAAAEAERAGVVRVDGTVAFVHPLVRAAVYEDAPELVRHDLHRQAARLLAASGPADAVDLERVAAHLLRTRAGDDLWVVESLLAGARTARRRGAPDVASRYLRRALEEAPARGAPELLLELGSAELAAGDPACVEHLTLAVQRTRDETVLVGAARLLARALSFGGAVMAAVELLQATRSRLADPDGEAALRLDLDVAATGTLDLATLRDADDVVDALSGRTVAGPLGRVLLAHRSVGLVRRGESAADAVVLAREALGDGVLFEEEGLDAPVAYFPVIALVLSDGLDEARDQLTRVLERSRSAGSATGFCLASLWRSTAALRAGDVEAAGADARVALDATASAELTVFSPYAVSFLTDVLLERGDLEEAEQLWAAPGLDADLPPVLPANCMLWSRGCLHLAQGRLRAGVRDLLESGRRQDLWRADGVGFWPWASRAALALHVLGEAGSALELAEQEVAAAQRFGAARPLGTALRARALLERGGERVRRLQEAVQVLAGSPARLELARAEVDLGVALLRTGRTAEGVELLEQGRHRAAACGATALVTSAEAELAAAGVRVRRPRADGVAALTISERRVAQLAAEGRTNREIAQALFVTPKTVETHLHHAFRKLGVTARRDLVDVPGMVPSERV